jgi:putative ABC transport system permease protein
MHLLEAVRLALRSLWANKLKSGFSLIGVFIGVTFLIAVVSIVEGMNRYMTDKFATAILGINTFHLRRRPDLNVGDTPREVWRAWARRPQITYEDAEAVQQGLTTPVVTAWESEDHANISYRGKVAKSVQITGATERYFDIKDLKITQGRPFTGQEVRAALPVAVMGWDLADRLFEHQDPLGKEIGINNIPYRIVGVVEKQGTLFGMSMDNFVIMPATSPIKNLVNPPRVVDALLVKANSIEEMRAALLQAEAIMRSRRHLRPNQDNNFTLETSEGVLEFWAKINRVLLAALPGLVSISLVVGGIVIMNIMLMSVAERTQEIGLRKSLGARRRDIMRQFVVESATLATIGAVIGVITGIVLAIVVAQTTPLPAAVAPWSVLVGVLLGAGVGIVSGVYPASRAARLDPIAALRQE